MPEDRDSRDDDAEKEQQQRDVGVFDREVSRAGDRSRGSRLHWRLLDGEHTGSLGRTVERCYPVSVAPNPVAATVRDAGARSRLTPVAAWYGWV